MSKSKLAAAMAKNRESDAAQGAREDFRKYTHEELIEEAFKARDPKTIDGVESAAKQRRQTQLLEKAGFKWVDVREVTPSEKNFYSIDDESIEELAAMILESKNTSPITLRETRDGVEIVDGERRVRAHLLLGERYGDGYFMVPARVFEYGSLDDEAAEYILNAMNLGQREMTPSERARGFSAIARMLKDENGYGDGAAKDIIARRFGISARAAQMEITIANRLCEEGQRLLDEGVIYKKTAEAMAGLDEEAQLAIIDQIRAGLFDKAGAADAVAEAKDAAKGRKRAAPAPKTVDTELQSAKKSIKRALKFDEAPDPVVVAELRVLMKEIAAKLAEYDETDGE